MTEFEQSNWAKPDFSQEFIDNADIYIVERRRLLEILKSFYSHFLKDGRKNRILDLGCGDGIISSELLKVDESISATLIDGSEDMLNRAKERLRDFKDVRFIRASFQEIINENIPMERNFDFVASSQAIHHLTLDEKKALFRQIYEHLRPEGYFVNIDVVLAPSENLEQWYMSLWREWIAEREALVGIEGHGFADIIRRYKDNKDNKPDTLRNQLSALKEIGFQDVDCFYKYGIFSIYGGRKG
jgi:tRNA (cmo5U34)-methyltransferase